MSVDYIIRVSSQEVLGLDLNGMLMALVRHSTRLQVVLEDGVLIALFRDQVAYVMTEHVYISLAPALQIILLSWHMHSLICFLCVLLSSAVLLYLYVGQQKPFTVNALCSLSQLFLLLQKELAHLVVVMFHVS